MNTFARNIMASLIQVNGASIGSIDTVTDVDLLGGKKNPMKGNVTKISKGCNVMFFSNGNSNGYKNMVAKRLQKEGKNPASFELSARRWGKRLADTPIVEHKGNYYIEVIFLNSPKTVTYELAGHAIDKDLIHGLKTVTESDSSQAGLDDKVIIRTYKLNSIKQLKMGSLSVSPV